MAEKLLQKLEEKMMVLISEVEGLRRKIHHLEHENLLLKQEHEKYHQEKQIEMQRIAEMIQLIDTVNLVDLPGSASMAASQPVLIHEVV
jgi:hypothetical protein